MEMNFSVNVNTPEQLRKVLEKTQDFKEEFSNDITVLMLRSFDKNFAEGGRPNKWVKSRAATLRNGMTLVDTGRLRRSLTVKGSPDMNYEVDKLSLKIGSTVPYAKTHNDGLTVRLWGKYPYKFPERRFILIQEEDTRNILEILKRGIDNASSS